MSQDGQYNDVDQADLEEWANTHNLTHPILQDTTGVAYRYVQTALPPDANSYSLPNMQLLSPGLVVEVTNGSVGPSRIEQYLPE